MTLEEARKKIKPLDEEKMETARKRWDSIAKPLHSLGKMEDLITQIVGITGEVKVDIGKKALVAMCADNGVVEEGVTQTGQEVTGIVADNFVKETTTACVMCHQCGVAVKPVDVGMVNDTTARTDLKVMYGTRNMTKGPAMTREEAVKGIEAGIAMAEELKAQGYRLLATGEMGIGNTTTSSAVASVLLDQPVETMTGRGAGLSSDGLTRKINAIKKAIALNEPDPSDPIDVLAKVGGLDIAEWTNPKGGYFIGFDSMPGCAKELVAKMKEAGVILTGAGATFPYHIDPQDRNIRLAPTFPTIDELKLASRVFTVCVRLVSAEKLLAEKA